MRIVAEVGSNWKTLNDCVESVRLAKEAGADAVKFQYFKNECLYGVKGMRQSLPNIPLLYMLAKELGIDFMCTAFSPKGYHYVNAYVQRHKIASSEITDLNLLDTVNSFKKPVYLSTGGASFKQIQDALKRLDDCEVTILYCVVAYPARVIDFRMLVEMQKTFGCLYQYGYSDHSTDALTIPVHAESLGCAVLEKHVNFTSHTDTPDAPHSLNFNEFKLMCDRVNGRASIHDTFIRNPHQRKLITLADGSQGYFRPSASE